MMAWIFLIGAICFEVGATISLKMLSSAKKLWAIGVGVGYVISLGFLALTLNEGMALGVAYGIWAAAGVALTAILSKILFNEPLTWLIGLGIVLITGGVLLVEFGATQQMGIGLVDTQA